MGTKKAQDQLPSLPQVLIRILDAIHSDSADFQRIADIIRQDAAIATRIIAVANSSYFGRPQRCTTIERALLFLGTDAVKTVIITAAIKQFFSHFNQRHQKFLKPFWRRSLVCANFAQVLATLTSYSAPEEAYLCGLLSDVGQLMLLTEHGADYLRLHDENGADTALVAAELRSYGNSHGALGADLIESWQISDFMADAVRYQHEPPALVQDAHHLVKIVNLANRLSAASGIDDEALATADALFGLNEALTRELGRRIGSDVDRMAQSLGIDIDDENGWHDAQRELGQRLSELGELAQVNTSLWQATTRESLRAAVRRTLQLTFDAGHSVLFLYDSNARQLNAHLDDNADGEADFTLPLESGRSLVSDALLTANTTDSLAHSGPLSVLDRQLLKYCAQPQILCWPLLHEQQPVGVLVLGVKPSQREQLAARAGLAKSICREVAQAIATSEARLESIGDGHGINAQQLELKIREAVHEASNPLSIIRNYLELLRVKLGEQGDAQESLTLIREEIDRVGHILLRLRDPAISTGADDTVELNTVLEEIASIFRQSLLATRQIQLNVQLDKKIQTVPVNNGHLRQIVTNLLKNAAEALPPQGVITLRSDSSISLGGRQYYAVSVQDNGPGIDAAIQQRLFSPVTSTKGEGHSGLGLSIVKKLVDEMGGSVFCRSNPNAGTEFQILIPKPAE